MARKRKRRQIFVFGSNNEGKHQTGRARYAKDYKGARNGKSEGLMKDCYAIPIYEYVKDTKTKGHNELKPLSEIKEAIDRFLEFANERPNLDFVVCSIGTGLNAYKHIDIAPMFEGAPKNCKFDIQWKKFLGDSYNYFIYEG